MKVPAQLLFLSALLCATSAFGFGDTFRCGVKKISVGDSESELVDACGRPASKRYAFETIRDAAGKVRSVNVEKYTYEDRDRHTTVMISVLDGEIVRISSR